MKNSPALVICLSLFSGTAFANPIMMVGKLSAQATGNTHVRLGYYTNSGTKTPAIAKTYGTSQSDWFTTGEQIGQDTGSGVQTMPYWFMCDCHVPTGSPLTYQAELASYFPPESLVATITPSPQSTALCDDKCAQAPMRDAGAEDPPDASLATDSPLATPVDAIGSSGGEKSGGGCSLAARRREGAFTVLLVLGLLALRRRR